MTWRRPPQPGSSGPQVQVLPAGEQSWVCCRARATHAGAAPQSQGVPWPAVCSATRWMEHVIQEADCAVMVVYNLLLYQNKYYGIEYNICVIVSKNRDTWRLFRIAAGGISQPVSGNSGLSLDLLDHSEYLGRNIENYCCLAQGLAYCFFSP